MSEDSINVAHKTKVIIKIDKKIDSIIVDNNLEFSFDNLKFGKAKISFKPKSIIDRTYIVKIKKKSRNEIIKLPYSLSCKYDRSIDNKICPVCYQDDEVLPISYGLIIEAPIFFKNKKELRKKKKERKKQKRTFINGGCIITDCDPNWYCERDEIEF